MKTTRSRLLVLCLLGITTLASLGCPTIIIEPECDMLLCYSCVKQGYKVEGRDCVFPDHTRCRFEDFYYGQCGQSHSFCEQHGGSISTVTEVSADGGIGAPLYAKCSFPDGGQCAEETLDSRGTCQANGAANPAAEYCIGLGFGLEQEQCRFPDASLCPEWDFYRGQCGQAHSYCQTHGGTLSTVIEDAGSWTAAYSICTVNGAQCTEESYWRTGKCL